MPSDSPWRLSHPPAIQDRAAARAACSYHPAMAPETAAADPHPAEPDDDDEALVEEELLVEEVSIDGMCGVY